MKTARLLVMVCVSLLAPLLLSAGEQPGNIAVASNEKAAGSPIAERMGRSPFYLIYDRDGTFIKAADNPNFGKRGAPGGTSAIDSIGFDEKGVMTGGIATPSREEREQTWDGFTEFFRKNDIAIVVAEEFGDEIVKGMKARRIECVAFKGSADQAVKIIVEGVRNEGINNVEPCKEGDEACHVPNGVPGLVFQSQSSGSFRDKATLIAAASDGNQATSLVSDDAYRCRYYLIFAGTGEILEVLDNPYSGTPQREGRVLVDFLAKKGVTVILGESFGVPMIEAMKTRGIRYVQFRGIARDGVLRLVGPGKAKDGTKGDSQ